MHSLFSELAHKQQLAPNSYLFHRGDQAYAIFSIISGRLCLQRASSDGKTITLHTARAGEFFAESALFSEYYHCDAIAETQTRLLSYDKTAFLNKLQQQPTLALQFIALQAQRIQKLRTQVELQQIRSARERVLQYLLLSANDNIIALDRPLKAMASDIGLSHEAFYRALAKLAQDGLINRSKTTIQLNI